MNVPTTEPTCTNLTAHFNSSQHYTFEAYQSCHNVLQIGSVFLILDTHGRAHSGSVRITFLDPAGKTTTYQNWNVSRRMSWEPVEMEPGQQLVVGSMAIQFSTQSRHHSARLKIMANKEGLAPCRHCPKENLSIEEFGKQRGLGTLPALPKQNLTVADFGKQRGLGTLSALPKQSLRIEQKKL